MRSEIRSALRELAIKSFEPFGGHEIYLRCPTVLIIAATFLALINTIANPSLFSGSLTFIGCHLLFAKYILRTPKLDGGTAAPKRYGNQNDTKKNDRHFYVAR